MRILVISDIHSNLTALEAVLADAGKINGVWCLGDIIGYGPDPNECINLVQKLPNLSCIIGNHDAAGLKQIDPATFNTEARQAIIWTQDALSPDNRAFLESLPEVITRPMIGDQTDPNVTLVHGSPRQPVWEYLLDAHHATNNFSYFNTAYCFVGHTHLPVLFHYTDNHRPARLIMLKSDSVIRLTHRAIINPGSVGQPRDRDSRAAYAIYNSEEQTIAYHRVDYDIVAVQKRMLDYQLPERHIRRLESGW